MSTSVAGEATFLGSISGGTTDFVSKLPATVGIKVSGFGASTQSCRQCRHPSACGVSRGSKSRCQCQLLEWVRVLVSSHQAMNSVCPKKTASGMIKVTEAREGVSMPAARVAI